MEVDGASNRVLVVILVVGNVLLCCFYLSYFDRCICSEETTTSAPLPRGRRIDQITNAQHKPFEISAEWMNLTESKAYADYGDTDCPANNYRPTFKTIFAKWDSISREYKILYFLNFGTLLGAWRNTDIIPTDSDMDLVIDLHDASKLLQFGTRDGFRVYVQIDWKLPQDQRRRFNCAGKQVKSQSDRCAFVEPLARLIHLESRLYIDIYGCNILYETVRVFNDYKQDLRKSLVFPLRRCKFMEMDSFCPNKPMAILKIYYSNLKPKQICKKGKWMKNNT